MITITESAKAKISSVLTEESRPYLRIYIQGGGCSGFEYGFGIDDSKSDDDFEFPAGSSSVLVDALSAQYLQGAEIDFIDDLLGSRFSIENPNAQTSCSCGNSFSPF